MSDLFHVSAAPHKRSTVTTKGIMRDVMIALLPAGLFGVYNFGIHALMVIAVTVLKLCAYGIYLLQRNEESLHSR